jgi:hypothetical protein
MARRKVQLSSEAEPIADCVAASFGRDAGLALSELRELLFALRL